MLDDWIDHFVKWTNCSPSNPALLLLDSARFHSKISPVTCGKRGLYVKILPAGRTWLLQPCDTNVFNHIKNSMARLERLQMSAQLSSSVVSRKSGPDQVDQNRSRLRCFEKFVAFVKKTLTSSEFPDETCSMQNREKWTTAEFHDPKNAAALVRAFSNSLRNEIDSARELPVRDSTTSTSSSSANSAARVGEKRSRESEVQAHRRVNSTGFVAGVTRHGPVRKVLKGRRLLRNQLFSRFFAVYFTTDFNAYSNQAFKKIHLWPPSYDLFCKYRESMTATRNEGRFKNANAALEKDVRLKQDALKRIRDSGAAAAEMLALLPLSGVLSPVSEHDELAPTQSQTSNSGDAKL